MPYIKQERRKILDPVIDELIPKLRSKPKTVYRVFKGIITGFLLSQVARSLMDTLHEMDAVKGDYNYTMCRIILGTLKPEKGWSYTSLNDAIAIIEHLDFELRIKEYRLAIEVCRDVIHELRRRLLDPYEDRMLFINGDIKEIKQETFSSHSATYA